LGRLLAHAHLPTDAPPIAVERWLDLTLRDKKTESGARRYVLLQALGRAVVHPGAAELDLRAIFG
jgi:3-dehydroquinate synthase